MGSSFHKEPQFPFQDMFGSGIIYPGKYELTNHGEHITHGQNELSGTSNTGCALSLLSCHSAANPVASSLVFHGICATNHSNEEVSEIHLGINSLDKYVQNESSSCVVNSMEAINNGSTVMPSESDCAAPLIVRRDEMCQPLDLSNVKRCPSPEDGATVDLFQLSSHLQRVEQQRNSFLQ